MGKFYLVAAAGVGLLFALAASADAGGRRTGQLPGQPFTPPGFSHNTTGQTHANWGTNSVSGQPQPPGFSHNTTGQTNGNWNATLGGVPPGLAKCPPGLTSC
jgi:hypothetical protein